MSQHIEYVPFGEVFIEERNNTWNTPYLFNAKELDEETGMYYYGARYYEPRLSLWMTVDPMEENLPSSSTYSYAANNPIRFIDMEGKIPFDKSVAHTRISSGFGIRKHPITGELKGHGGIDLATAGTGHDVHVLADGVVKKVGWNVKVDSKGNKTGYGRYVIVQHSDGYETLYAHLDKNGVAVSVGDVTTAAQVVRMIVELHLLVVVVRLEVAVCSPCSCHSTGLCCFGRTVVAAEALTVYVVVIVLTVIRLVKRLVVILNGLQLLIVFILVVNGKTISLIACVWNSSWVCAIRSEVAKFRYDTLTTYIDMLGVLTTLPCHEVWTDIKREACRTGVATRELGVHIDSFVFA